VEIRIRHSAEFKAKVALEALKGLKTVNELAGQYQLHPRQISQWKRQVFKNSEYFIALDLQAYLGE
jgi:transposase-like protein